jgi:hypothetical protein
MLSLTMADAKDLTEERACARRGDDRTAVGCLQQVAGWSALNTVRAEQEIVMVATPSTGGRETERVFGHMIEVMCRGPCEPSRVRDRTMVKGPRGPSSNVRRHQEACWYDAESLPICLQLRDRVVRGRLWLMATSVEAAGVGRSRMHRTLLGGRRGERNVGQRRAGGLTRATWRAGWRIQPIGCLVVRWDGRRRCASRWRVLIGRNSGGDVWGVCESEGPTESRQVEGVLVWRHTEAAEAG